MQPKLTIPAHSFRPMAGTGDLPSHYEASPFGSFQSQDLSVSSHEHHLPVFTVTQTMLGLPPSSYVPTSTVDQDDGRYAASGSSRGRNQHRNRQRTLMPLGDGAMFSSEFSPARLVPCYNQLRIYTSILRKPQKPFCVITFVTVGSFGIFTIRCIRGRPVNVRTITYVWSSAWLCRTRP